FAKIIENPEDLTANIDSAFKKVDFSVKTSGGTIVFEDNHHFDYPIDALDFKGEVKGGLDEIRLKKAVLQMQDQTVQLGVAVTGYQKYFFEKSLDDLKLSLNAKTKELSMDDLAKFWPKYYSEPAWRWCKDNLYGGTYQDADFHFEWAYDQNLKSVELKTLEGVAHITGGTIWYMEEMPKVTDVDGTAKFDIGIIDIAVEKGMSDGLKIDKGHVKLYDLAEEHNFIDISIQGQTSIKQALEYINHPPLEFAKDLGIDPKKVQGRVDIDLNLNFELYEDLKSEDIKVKTTAILHDVIVKNVFEGKDLSASRADLKVTENGLNAKGHALFGTIPVQFDYGIDFSKKDTESKGHFALTYDNQTGEKLGLKETLLQAPYMEGYAFVNADITTKNNVSEMDIKADLTHMALDYSFFGLVKPVDKAGSIHTKLVIKDGHLTRVPLFELKSDDFSMKGDISLDNRSRVQTINISNIEGNKTSAAAKIEYSNTKQQHVKINISGSSYNLESLFDSRDEDQKKKPKTEALSNDDDGLETWPDTDVFIAVSSLWTNPDTPIKNFAGSATIKNGIGFDEVHMVGNLGADKSIKFNLDYTPHINQEHRLMIESNNAGSTLKVLRLYENMSGGNLKIEAKREPNKKFIGHAQIRDFKIYNTPLLTKLLTVASFSGMLDLLKGDGLVFSHFDAPFTYAGKVLTINDAKMFGNVIGLTATGSVNRINEDINIQGVVSPAYGLNSLMGKIPLIGKFLAGKDGTVFAVDYTITDTISAPNVELYPLSLLSPNSVKELFADESGQ
ncbi:MAG: AsmA-like C-terminal domain-containing protein, partial [Alphaproteobacteria bacterium]|nr:AsmA-like C-terminal domain-containing protein [Alphaproteobacteria bacterium]